MTTSNHGRMGQPIAHPWRTRLQTAAFVFLAMILASITALLCRVAASVSLGLFFGSVGFAAILVPPLLSGMRSILGRVLIPFAITAGISLVWLTAIGEQFTFMQWLACSGVLLSFLLAVGGVCALVACLPVNRIVVAGGVTILALLWLTWPVWLSQALLSSSGDALATWLVPAHPLFAINGVLSHFDAWDRYPLAYSKLTVLNQDVFYKMPTSAAWAMSIHSAIGAVTFAAASWHGLRAGSSRSAAHSALSPAGRDPEPAAK